MSYSPKVFLKRINREIQNFNQKKYLENNNYSQKVTNFLDNLRVTITICNYGDRDNYYLTIDNLKNNKIFLILEIPEHYPFKPYSVINYNSISLNNKLNIKHNYLKYMNNVYEKIKHRDFNIYKFFYKFLYSLEPRFLNLDKDSCFCCNSITCLDLWSASITFNDMIFQELEIKFIENYSSQIAYRYLSNIYGNLLSDVFIKFPEEIIEKILTSKT